MGSLSEKAKHRTFLLSTMNKMCDSDIESMKFVMADEVGVRFREKASPLKFLEILGQLEYWVIKEDGRVDFAKFADLCGAVDRLDLKNSLRDYEAQHGASKVRGGPFTSPIAMASDDVEPDGNGNLPSLPPPSIQRRNRSEPGCSAIIFEFLRSVWPIKME